MKNLNNILIIGLIILLLVIGYGVFRTDKIQDSPQLAKSELLIQQLNKDKETMQTQIEFLQAEYSNLSIELKDKNNQIRKKDREIKNLENILNEKIDSINSLDDNGNFKLFSNWISKNN